MDGVGAREEAHGYLYEFTVGADTAAYAVG